MFPREKYAGDVDTRVYSLNSNANCWRALRDMSVVLRRAGRHRAGGEARGDGRRSTARSSSTRSTRRSAATSIRRSCRSRSRARKSPHVPIWASTMGSYWNLMIEYVIGSGVFTADSQTMTDVLRYIQQNGGLCMGMLRARTTPGNFWVYGGRINDLYGMRYALALLQRDEADRALVSFYGKLAQGMTRDTFIGCEGSSMAPARRVRPADGPAAQQRRQRELPPAAPLHPRAGLRPGRRRPRGDAAARVRHAAAVAGRRASGSRCRRRRRRSARCRTRSSRR